MPKEATETSESEESGKRYFKMIDPKTMTSIGRYTGFTPKQAGSKAFSKIIRKIKQEGGKIPKTNVLYLRESTRNSLKKLYAYSASRDKLKNPQEVYRKNDSTGDMKTVVYKYRNKLKKSPIPEQLAGHYKKSKKERETSGGSKKSSKKQKKSEMKEQSSGSKKSIKKKSNKK